MESQWRINRLSAKALDGFAGFGAKIWTDFFIVMKP
jgi:hypothetical protein